MSHQTADNCVVDICRVEACAATLGLREKKVGLHRNGRSVVLGEHRVDVSDETRNEACMFGAAPPGFAAFRSEQAAQVRSDRQFESPFWKNTALRSLPNVEGGPEVFLKHLLQPQLIGGIERTLSVQAGGHQFGNVAVLGDRHPDHRPLRHRGIVLVPLEGAGVLPDLESDKDQRRNHAD